MQGPMPKPCQVIVVGNEKGGSGKSTTAINVAIGLMHDGFRVATLDLDSRQRSLSRFIAHRKAYAQAHRLAIAIPTHRTVLRSEHDSQRTNLWADYEAFAIAISEVEREHDCVVIDTPGHEGALTRAAHSAADILITPLNDSFVDLDVIAEVETGTYKVLTSSYYTDMVLAAQRERRAIDVSLTDWIVVRNRVSALETRNRRIITDILGRLSQEFGFRVSDNISERVIFRELFPNGLTPLDPLEYLGNGKRVSMSHLAARVEIRGLVAMLRLPGRELARQRLKARATWAEANSRPLVMPELSPVFAV